MMHWVTGLLRGLTWEGLGPASLSVPGRLLGLATSARCCTIGWGHPLCWTFTYLVSPGSGPRPFLSHEWLEGVPGRARGWGGAGCRLNLTWAGAAAQGPLATTAATWALLPGGGQRQAPPEAGPISACAPAWGQRPALWEAAVAVEQEPVSESQLPGLWFLPKGAPDPQAWGGAWGWAGYMGPIALCRACGGGLRLITAPSLCTNQEPQGGRLGHPAPGAAPRAAPGWCVWRKGRTAAQSCRGVPRA